MDKKPSPNKGRQSHLGEIKTLLAAAAITATLAFWNVFSRPTPLETPTETTPTEVVVTPEAPVVMLDLPPMPTLIPPLPDTPLVVSPIQAGPDTSTVVQLPVQPTGKIILGGSQPGSVQSQPQRSGNHKPAARTRSSH
jgi:hypothetical protein